MTLHLPAAIAQTIRDLSQSGYRAAIVGGAVRDALLGIEPKDFDIEVYGITYDQLAAILGRQGRVDLVGKSFGVIKFTAKDESPEHTSAEPLCAVPTFDFSIPRRDSKTGPHHRDFTTTFDASITPEEAASRRDFTINAMAYDPVHDELLDFFGGERDLRQRTLRATSSAFTEDPLRVLRGMQFACRFDLDLDPATAQMSRDVADQYKTLATERVGEEFMKWAIKADSPGRLGPYLRETGWLIHFPEIASLYGTPQDPQWHPEGDVGVHTMLVLNEAARVASRDNLDGDERAILLFSALTHDFAKPATTQLRDREGQMRWTSWGHEAAGGPMARTFLEHIGIKSAIIDPVVKLVEHHLAHHSIAGEQDEITPRAARRLALRLSPANIEQLIRLIEADASGRPPLEKGLPATAARLLEAAQAQSVHQHPQAPYILGRHVLPYFDNRPGKHIGDIARAAYVAQVDGAFSTEEEALQWLDQEMSRRLHASQQ